ncbi:MAG: ankyrin repeat domain-containing protein [Rickettsiales bacterium]|nr:ankyrin repeat domain-containing protein [Rickettsiales bacterium]
MERGVDINKQHRFGREECYPVYAAVRFGPAEILEDMIERGVDLTVKVDGRSLLWYSDKEEITELLLKNSEINLEERGKYGKTLFMKNILLSVSSSDHGNLDNAKYLLRMGSDINAQDNIGNTALHKML